MTALFFLLKAVTRHRALSCRCWGSPSAWANVAPCCPSSAWALVVLRVSSLIPRSHRILVLFDSERLGVQKGDTQQLASYFKISGYLVELMLLTHASQLHSDGYLPKDSRTKILSGMHTWILNPPNVSMLKHVPIAFHHSPFNICLLVEGCCSCLDERFLS